MKNGLDWMPLDVHPDIKWELIESEYGLTGFAVLVKLTQKIYAENGYYLEWSEDAVLLFAKTVGLSCEMICKIVDAAVRRGIFDPDLYARFHVLTSADIQKQFFNAVRRRREIHLNPDYLLIDAGAYVKSPVKTEIVDKKDENADIFEQSRAEESKAKKSRVKESREEEPPSHPEDAEALPAPSPTKESLTAQYGEAVVGIYLKKAAGYRYRGANAVAKAAEWLAADVLSGKLELSEKRPPSFDLEEYDAAVRAFTPVYDKKHTELRSP